MPAGLRFCRNCGFRLGEGSAEYTETVRFQNVSPGALPGNNAPNSAPYGFAAGPMSARQSATIGKRRRISGTSWMFIGLLIFFITSGVLTALVKQIPRMPRGARGGVASVAAPKSFAGVDDFKTAEGDIGATFDSIKAPGSPADKAGLIGGDIITTFDGVSIHSANDISDVLERTPIGKTVEVVYIRDGETKNAKLTTISEEELERLSEEFSERPEGLGRFGYHESGAERVEIPGTKLFGVRLDKVDPSLPADMAGVKNGDIVIEFDGKPIRTPEEFRARVRRAIPYQPVDVVIMRGGERLTIPVKLGKVS